MKISIITPCYNEDETIPYMAGVFEGLIKNLKKRYDVEVIFIDDGSKDNTYKLLKKYYSKSKYVKIFRHQRNMGFGAAFRTGIKNSTGDIIVQIDADCTYPIKEVPKMIADIKYYDVVTASPLHTGGKIKGLPLHRLFLSKSISLIYKVISGSNINTFTCAFRAYKGDMLRNLKYKSDRFTCAAEILILLILNNYRVKEVPSVLSNRKYGQSKMKILSTIVDHLGLISRLIWIRLTNR